MEGVCKPGQSDPKIGNPTAPRACVPLPSCSPASVQIKGGQCPGSRGGAQEAGRAAPRNSGCGQAAGARDAKPAATAEQPSGRPTFAPPCVLRGSAAGRRPNPCSRVASARLAGHKVRSTAVRGPRPRRRRRHRHRSCQHEMSESRQTHVTLHDIDPQALDQLVQFAYTAEIVVGEGNVQVRLPHSPHPCTSTLLHLLCHSHPFSASRPVSLSLLPGPLSCFVAQTLLPAASLLQLNGVRDACCKFLLSQLDPSNCLGIRGFADTHSCSDLLKAAHRYVLQHFVDVAKTEEFMLLPLKQVLELVSSDSLNVPSEEDVYRAVLSWVKHDVDARRQHVPRLMKCVRLPLLSRDFLLGHVDAESLVRHHPDCKDLLIEALKFHLLPEQRGVLGTSRTRPRRCEGAGPVLFAVGGGSLFAIHGDCEAYDTRTDRWHVVASMSTRRARVGVAAVGNRLYAVGGYDGTSDLATVESYDPVTNTWQPEVSMGTRRSCLGVATLHGLLYAAGGYDGASCLNSHASGESRSWGQDSFATAAQGQRGPDVYSAERYDPLTGTWTSIAAMSTRRRYVRVAMLDGNLYAVGGYDSSSHLATVEKYEPQVNSWTPAASMLSRRSSAGVAVLEGALYVAGGNDGTSCLNSVERYSPKAGAWESVAPMNIRRSTHDLVAMDGWLFAVGGNDGSSSLNSIEKYNPRTNKWVAASCMFTRRSSVGVAVLELLNFPPPSSPTLSVSSTSL
ncbi:kelch-like protein 17 isoform X3 [Sus scrofa]|uniref:kelch-like protein 17 isoform X3 n=1 Tax=Sus scrofa TaxID=9823 RepID=UPI000A2B6C3D|nr:kelch-like protein 17 isoform X3 [Sus scrofa]